MSIIRFSPDFSSSVTSKIFCKSFTSQGVYDLTVKPAYSGFLVPKTNDGSLASRGGRIAIMKGAVPTSFSELTTFNTRANDVLVMFDSSPSSSSNALNDFAGTIDTTNPVTISTLYVNASASGVATWFWCFVTPANYMVFDNSATIINQFFGTVGITGSGADLTLPTTNIVMGNPYRIYNLQFQFPTEWNN